MGATLATLNLMFSCDMRKGNFDILVYINVTPVFYFFLFILFPFFLIRALKHETVVLMVLPSFPV